MGKEIERKFLVGTAGLPLLGPGRRMRQGYLALDEARSVRVRESGGRAWLTIKGAAQGYSRAEYEYEIPLEDARNLLDALCHPPVIDKTRFDVPFGGRTWEVDVFHGANEGLVVAEIELSSEDESFERPPWLGEDVSHDPRYYNVNLVRCPYRDW
jgi:adenylate cyclase